MYLEQTRFEKREEPVWTLEIILLFYLDNCFPIKEYFLRQRVMYGAIDMLLSQTIYMNLLEQYIFFIKMRNRNTRPYFS